MVPDRDPAHTVLGQARRLVLRAAIGFWPCPSTPARSPSSTSSPASSPRRWPRGSSAPSARASRPRPSSWRRWRYREPAAFEVIVRVMAAGVNFNNVWAALGKPISVFRYHAGGPPHRRLGRVRDRLGGRRGRDALEARRRGRRALQPGLLRGRRGARARPAGRAVAADLGLRDDLGLVRAVLQGPGPAAAAQAEGAGVGGGRVLRPDVLHRLPHARRPGAPAGGPPRADLGRRGRPRRVRHPALPARGRRLARRRLLAREGRAGQVARRRRLHRPQRVRRHDAPRRRGLRRREGALQGVTPLRQGRRARSSAASPTSSSSTSGAPRSRPRCSSSSRSAPS